MRAFDILPLLIFLLVYLAFTTGAQYGLQQIITKKLRLVKVTVFVWSLLLFSTLVFLYIWPLNSRNATDYQFYLIFNLVFFLDINFKIPLALSALFSIPFKRHRKTINSIGVVFAIGIATSLLYGGIVGKTKILIKEVTINFENLPSSFHNYKIAQISDIHLGSFLRSTQLLENAIKEINHQKPDLLLFTGDLVNNFSQETKGYFSTFNKLSKNIDCYSILGNHDYGNYSRWESDSAKNLNFNTLLKMHEEFGFQLLRNENKKLRMGTDSIYLVGVENWGHPPFPQYANLKNALLNVPDNSFQILMSHDPAHWESIIKNKSHIALTLSGHTHGMQWGVKIAGIPFSLGYLVRKNWSGLYNHDQSQLYVNQGLGTVGIPMRIDMPPEVTFITLKRSKIDGE